MSFLFIISTFAKKFKKVTMILKKRRWHCLPGQEPIEMDRRIMEFEKNGKLVPTRNLIKTPEHIEGIRRAVVGNTVCLKAVSQVIDS